ncbi:hypothetical protein QS257_14770 [Terrilactibacillus sp. S3-3]|nr:hypothetical protein QS257_14770 [Terrilactibacillus sp. S3-3]
MKKAQREQASDRAFSSRNGQPSMSQAALEENEEAKQPEASSLLPEERKPSIQETDRRSQERRKIKAPP